MSKKKILLAPNSFKECADSVKVIELFEKYLRNKDIEILKYPLNDGGDGFLNSLKFNFELEELTYSISTPYDDSKFECQVLNDKSNKTIYIESAKVLGLQIIPEDKRHPLYLSSKGLGELLNQINNSILAGEIEAKRVVIGIGGTGTNDLGLGVCSIFGMELIDIYGKQTEIIPMNYSKVENIRWSKPNLVYNIECLIDVYNPLLGENGATYQFAKQKGASDSEIKLLETGFIKFCNILNNSKLYNLASSNYGAGGGLAAGLSLFLSAKCNSSFDYLVNDKKLVYLMNQADIIVTGEGKFDETSLIGKGASTILKLGGKCKKKIVLCCGQIDNKILKKLSDNIQIIQMNKFSTLDNYKVNFEKEVKNACNKIIQAIS